MFPEEEKVLAPFNESAALNEVIVSGTINNDEIREALLAMTGTSTDNYIPFGTLSASTGFTFSNTDSGIDSLAFGGLKR